MRILATRVFSKNRELSSIYSIKIDMGDGCVIATFTIDQSAIDLFLEKMQRLNPELALHRVQTNSQDGSAIYSWRTNNHTLITTLNGLKEASLISIEFADEICRELPNLIQRAQHSPMALGLLFAIDSRVDNPAPSTLPTLDPALQVESDTTVVTQDEIDLDLDNIGLAEYFDFTHRPHLPLIARHPISAVHDDTPPKDEEWSTKIETIMDPFHFSLFDYWDTPQLRILTESEARAIIKSYSDGCFVIFRRNETHHLLAKVNSAIRQFDILTKSHDELRQPPFYLRLSFDRQYFFNLKDEEGHLLFNAKGVSASSLYSFLNSHELRERFPFQLNLRGMTIFGQKADSLKTLGFRQLLIQDPSLSWVPKLPEVLQDGALFHFLNTFISKLHASDIQSLIENNLFGNHGWAPTYRKHYSIEELKRNLNSLRALGSNGNTKAAMLLATLVYSGLGEHDDSMGRFPYRLALFPPTRQKKEPILRDLEEYREITQNPVHFRDKIVRDLFLLRYFEAKKDAAMINTQLKVIDLNQAIWLSTSFCSDYTILSCIALDEVNNIEKLISNKGVLHHFVSFHRTFLADKLKHKLPDEVLKEKDEDGRNILHTLVAYLSANGILGSRPILDMFDFICQRFPDMLAETDGQGRTVYDDIERLKLDRNSEWNRNTHDEIESTIAKCHGRASSLGYS